MGIRGESGSKKEKIPKKGKKKEKNRLTELKNFGILKKQLMERNKKDMISEN